jgi:choline dehydrogenase
VSAAVYDYVVVGAGSAGCAVAARLASASYTVLLIEAGGSDRRIPVRAPLAYGAQMGGPTDWAFESEPEPGWDDIESVFRRIESGPMRVTRVAEPDEVSRRFVAAAQAAGAAANDDVSGPDLDGAAVEGTAVELRTRLSGSSAPPWELLVGERRAGAPHRHPRRRGGRRGIRTPRALLHRDGAA